MNHVHAGLPLALLTLAALAPAAAPDDVPSPPEHLDDRARATHRFEDVDRWASIWDDPSRAAWQEPQKVVQLMDLQAGMRVADIGAGTGYFNHYLSAAVGPKGTVFAVDIEPTMVEHMRERAQTENTPNVTPVLGVADDPRLPVDQVDRILMVDTFHHIDHRIAYFQRLRERLGPDGLFVDVDWKPGDLTLGPPPQHKIAPEEVAAELAQAGFEQLASHELKYQYVLVFRPKPSRGDD